MAAIHVPRTVGELDQDPAEPFADGQVPAWDATLGRLVPSSLGADARHVHDQASPVNSATINHGLNKFPSVTVVDSAGTWWIVQLTYIDTNTVRLDFAGAMSFTAYFN